MRRNPWEKEVLLGGEGVEEESTPQPDLRTQLYQSLLEKAKARRQAAERAAAGAPQVEFSALKDAADDRNLMSALMQGAARVGNVKSNFGDYASRQNDLDSQNYAEKVRLEKRAEEAGLDELKLAMNKSDLDEKLADKNTQRAMLRQQQESLNQALDANTVNSFNSAMQKYGINIQLPANVTYGQVKNMPFVSKVFEKLPDLHEKFMDLEGKKLDRENASQQQAFGRTNDLSKDYYSNQVTKDTQVKRAQHSVITGGLSSANATGDMAAIFGVMKMFDPGSTVREGEFASAKNASGVPDRVQAMYNGLLRGEMLSPKQRKEFQSIADDLLQRQLTLQAEIDSQFGVRAKNSGVNSSDFLIDNPAAPTQSSKKEAAAPTQPSKKEAPAKPKVTKFKEWKQRNE